MTAAARRASFGVAARAALAALALVACASARAEGPPASPPEPADYKMDDYRSPTPATLAGAKVVGTPEAEAVWRDKSAVFIDTMPRDVRPKDLPKGTVWRDKPRAHLPGSAWLANVGYGAISPEMTAYFRDGLAALSGGDMEKPLLFYCRAECWMSWNAAKRALGWGYRNVLWYPEGTDGWEQAGLPLEPAMPYAAPGQAPTQ